VKVKCICEKSDKLERRHYAVGYTKRSRLALEKEQIYHVCGISLWKGLLSYLILDDDELPVWYPTELFSVIDSSIPSTWCFAEFSNFPSYDLEAIWGYLELTNSGEHYDELAVHDLAAIDLFIKRKSEMYGES